MSRKHKLDLLDSIEKSWLAQRGSARFRARFQEWVKRFPDLGAHGDIRGFEAWFRSDLVPYEEKNEPARTLSTLVQEGDEQACLLLAYLFIPGLGTATRELFEAGDRLDDAQSNLLEGFRRAAHEVSSEVEEVLGFLRNRARDIARNDLQREQRRQKRQASLERVVEVAEHVLGTREDVAAAAVGGAQTPADVLDRAQESGVIDATENRLIRATRLDGFELELVAGALGMTYKAAHERRRRAEARIVAWIKEREIPAKRKIPTRVEMRARRAPLETSRRKGEANDPKG